VNGILGRANTMGKGAGIRNDQVVLTQVKAFKGKGIEGEIELVTLMDEGEVLHKRRADIPRTVGGGHVGGVIHRGEDGRVGIEHVQSF